MSGTRKPLSSTCAGIGLLLALIGTATGARAQELVLPPLSAPLAVARSVADSSDVLIQAGELEAAQGLLESQLERSPNDDASLMMATRLFVQRGMLEDDREARKAILRHGDEYGRRLVELRPFDPDAYAWAAAIRGHLAQAEDGTRRTAGIAKQAWELTERSLELNPEHALANHVVAMIYREVARLSGIARFFGRLLIGNEFVSNATWESALRHHLIAVRQAPEMAIYHLEMGETYRFMERWTDARDVYHTAVDAKNREPGNDYLMEILQERLMWMEGAIAGASGN